MTRAKDPIDRRKNAAKRAAFRQDEGSIAPLHDDQFFDEDPAPA